MDNRLETFILFLKDNEIYYRYMKNVKKSYYKIRFNRTDFLKFINVARFHAFCWFTSDEGYDYWANVSNMWNQRQWS